MKRLVVTKNKRMNRYTRRSSTNRRANHGYLKVAFCQAKRKYVIKFVVKNISLHNYRRRDNKGITDGIYTPRNTTTKWVRLYRWGSATGNIKSANRFWHNARHKYLKIKLEVNKMFSESQRTNNLQAHWWAI